MADMNFGVVGVFGEPGVPDGNPPGLIGAPGLMALFSWFLN